VVANDAALQLTLAGFKAERDAQLRFPLNSMQCTDATWRAALDYMLGTSDLVVMDLGGFSETNGGCVYELRQIIEHVPLQRVMLVLDDDTNKECMEEVLAEAWSGMSPSSPNAGAEPCMRTVRLRAEPTESGPKRMAIPVTPADKDRFAGVLLDLVGETSSNQAIANTHWARSGLPGPFNRL
jgi:hypothetical protein